MLRASTCSLLSSGMSVLRGDVAEPSSGRLEKENTTFPPSTWINGLVLYAGLCPKLWYCQPLPFVEVDTDTHVSKTQLPSANARTRSGRILRS